MAGPSKSVGGGYLGYSALTDSYWNALNRVRKDQTQTLEQEKQEIEQDQALTDKFTIPETQASRGGGGGARGPGGKRATVVGGGDFAYSADPNDQAVMEYLQPLQVNPEDQAALALHNYRKNVTQQQKEISRGPEFNLQGSKMQAGGGFNSALQGALEGLKGEYLREGRRTSRRKRREGRARVDGQLQALQTFGTEVQSLQTAYKDAMDNDLISHGTGTQFIDFLNTISGNNDLQVVWENGRGFLRGSSSANSVKDPVTGELIPNVNLPLDNIEAMKNALVLKKDNPSPMISSLIEGINKSVKTIDERGVEVESNELTPDKKNQIRQQLGTLIPDADSTLSMGIDWLGFDGAAWKKKVKSDPDGARSLIVETLAGHVESQHTPSVSGLSEAELTSRQKGEESARHNRATEALARDKFNKDKGRTKGTTPENAQSQARFMQDLVQTLNVDFTGTKKGENDQVLSTLIGGKVKNAAYRVPNKDTEDQFPEGYFEVVLAGGGKNLIDINDKELLLEYVAQAQGIPRNLIDVYLGQLGGQAQAPAAGGNERSYTKYLEK